MKHFVLSYSIYFICTFLIKSNAISYDNGTLFINDTNDFQNINVYQNNTTSLIIGDGIEMVQDGTFSYWPLLSQINFSNSVKIIGDNCFYLCGNLETIFLGENIKTIGSSFALCSVRNLRIPNSVETIGFFSFFSSKLETLILGSGIKNIEQQAFDRCSNLVCIYFYGENEPTFGDYAFFNVTAIVMTYSFYKGTKFGHLNVSVGSVINECISVVTFTQSNTKPSTIESNTLTPDTFTPNTFSHSTYIESNIYTPTNVITNSLNSVSNELIKDNTENDNTLIIIISVCCGVVVIVIAVVVGVVIYKRKKKQNPTQEHASDEYNEDKPLV